MGSVTPWHLSDSVYHLGMLVCGEYIPANKASCSQKISRVLIFPSSHNWKAHCVFKDFIGLPAFCFDPSFLEKDRGGSHIDTERHFLLWCRGFFPGSVQILICFSYQFFKFGLMKTLQVLPDTSSFDEHGDSWKLQIGLMIRANM